jgi:uncharacterized protein (DUF58 family)
MSELTSILAPELLERIEGLALIARHVVNGVMHGLHRSSVHGMSVEFAQHREYVPGDDLKHLDWKVLGRADRYVIRQYQQETNLRALVLVDCSGSMGYDGAALPGNSGGAAPQKQQAKFEYARVLAAALTHLLIQQGDSVGLMLASDQIRQQLDARAAPGQVMAVCQMLLASEPAGVTAISRVIDQLASGLQRRSLVILVSDLLDDPTKTLESLGRLVHAGHEAIVFQVLDRRETTFDFGPAGTGITVLKDLETSGEFEAEPRLIAHLVRSEIKKFLAQLDSGARKHGIHLVRCITDDPPADVLTRYLQQREGR